MVGWLLLVITAFCNSKKALLQRATALSLTGGFVGGPGTLRPGLVDADLVVAHFLGDAAAALNQRFVGPTFFGFLKGQCCSCKKTNKFDESMNLSLEKTCFER